MRSVRENQRMYEATGKIKLISDTQNFPSGFSKREFVVTTGDGKYPQDLKFEMVKDKCAILDNYKEGSDVKVSFDIRGNEYNGKYYVNLSCWKLEGGSGGGGGRNDEYSQESRSSAEPSAADLRKEDDFDDEQIPF
jgi:single-strand DNA-binding protein